MSVGIFKNGKYNKVAGNAKDSTAANTTYNNGTSGLQANNVQSAIDEVSAKIGQENISQVGNSVTGAINNLNSNLANHINGFSNVNVNGTVSYMQIGKLVIVRLINHTISGISTLGVPAGSSSFVVSLRDEINGKLAKFWFNGEDIDVYMAENYTSGHTYTGQFCYIST